MRRRFTHYAMLNKTLKGTEVLQTRSMILPSRQRTLLLLSNGERSHTYLLKQTEGLGASLSDIEMLVGLGLLEDKAAQSPPISPPLAPPPSAAIVPEPPLTQPAPQVPNELNDLRVDAFRVRDEMSAGTGAETSYRSMPISRLESDSRPFTEPEKFEYAYRAATKLSSELGLRGFRLQLSLERASTLVELRALRPKLLEALTRESGAAEAAQRLRTLDKLLRA
jgi:hypothetical protein